MDKEAEERGELGAICHAGWLHEMAPKSDMGASLSQVGSSETRWREQMASPRQRLHVVSAVSGLTAVGQVESGRTQ